jgi:hypothetical protein
MEEPWSNSNGSGNIANGRQNIGMAYHVMNHGPTPKLKCERKQVQSTSNVYLKRMVKEGLWFCIRHIESLTKISKWNLK